MMRIIDKTSLRVWRSWYKKKVISFLMSIDAFENREQMRKLREKVLQGRAGMVKQIRNKKYDIE